MLGSFALWRRQVAEEENLELAHLRSTFNCQLAHCCVFQGSQLFDFLRGNKRHFCAPAVRMDDIDNATFLNVRDDSKAPSGSWQSRDNTWIIRT
jgi:hypothetical protein